MATEILQVRDVPAEDAQALRARAAARHMSLSGYLRELIHEEVSRPTMSEVLKRISSRSHSEASGDEIRSFVEDGRR